MIIRYIALRFLFARSDNNFFSSIALASFLGILLGVTILTIVSSVMNGFDSQLKDRLLGVVPHVYVEGSGLDATRVESLLGTEAIKHITPFIAAEGMMLTRARNHFLEIYGVSEDLELMGTKIHQAIGQKNQVRLSHENGLRLLLSQSVARGYRLDLGDPFYLLFPIMSESGDTVRPKMYPAYLGGTFAFRSELDSYVALAEVGDISNLLNRQIGSRLYLENVLKADEIAGLLQQEGFKVEAWTERFGNFFRAVSIEKNLLLVVMLLVIAISSTGIISALTMLIEDKRNEVAILRTIGLRSSQITSIFLFFGGFISLLAVVSGLVIGVILSLYVPNLMAWVSSTFGFSIIEGTYFSQIPIQIRFDDLALIATASLAVSFIAGLVPSLRAARILPTDALR
ncbi:MAG: FtsX-like permease family protein [Candidatus Azotimanducaceae bacterium]